MGSINENKIISYDIFDTCFCRICGCQDFLFELLASSVLGDEADDSSKYDFVIERKRGEEYARKKSNREEISIFDIYENTDFSLFTSISNHDILELELNIHSSLLVPVHETKQEIDELHMQGRNVIYISDMYLPEFFIMNILKQYGFYIEGDTLFVSSDVGLTKETGHLYDYIKERLCIDFKQWYHKGDNDISDFKIPKKKGIHARKISYGFSYYEHLIAKNETSTSNLDIIKTASCARATRLLFQDTPHVKFAADFIAPAYVPFVYYTLKDAEKRGIQQLYFIARDGYILLKIAEVFHSQFPNIKLKYLYASRKSLYFPGINTLSLDNLLEIFPANESESIYDLLSYLQVSHLKINPNQYLGKEKETILKELLNKPDFIIELTKRHEEQRELCVQYFKEVGLIKPNSALVDVYGTRKCGHFINNILRENGYNTVYSYYYGVMENRIKHMSHFTAFIYNERIKMTINDSIYSQKQNILEQYFSMTSSRRTSGYKKQMDKIEPIFEHDNHDNSYEQIISSTNINICQKFAEFYLKLKIRDHVHCCQTAQLVFNTFIHAPRKEFLLALKDFYESDNEQKTKLLYKAPVFTLLKKRSKAGWFPGLLIYNSGIFYRLFFYLLSFVWKYKSSTLLKPY
jgi:FMN phosphatase YigB (HAD superfamily)